MAHKVSMASVATGRHWSKTGKGKPCDKKELEPYPDPNGNRKQRLAYRKMSNKNERKGIEG